MLLRINRFFCFIYCGLFKVIVKMISFPFGEFGFCLVKIISRPWPKKNILFYCGIVRKRKTHNLVILYINILVTKTLSWVNLTFFRCTTCGYIFNFSVYSVWNVKLLMLKLTFFCHLNFFCIRYLNQPL